ncbi:phosphoglycerate dehydrogenase [Moraxella bovis]|uniref:D-3-phosphoglycerate dehydrogenase n=1 Tax=Moraxella bovis TaxID=476 RepID=A0AAX3EW79_MORBO|nr:phosphoglycerate dehydrogenase [Moraxella bovis]AWY19609.1 phosphoglycerate dehydrogenase [Moraxella bovis]UYZ80621.1 phosphoglycerate dehydrogenase [Moraxella bovis]UYZ90018.1 phosphoglycerate dehydrogenase [Moraxella bovis]UYZ94817.1 phosphoglycerate dehydrogenase [Moraxella bovis]UZA05676.1 phosphoglycerate dehydrogenase [Moraxella bovis]
MTLSLNKDKIRFLLLEGVHDNALKVLNEAGYTNIEYIKTALDEDELIEKIKDAHFIGIRSRTQLTRKVLESAEKLICIGCFCIGTNQVDLDAALELGIPVFNAPYSNTRSVAELVLAETIMLMRGIPEKNAVVHRGGWNKSAKDSYEVRGKTMGIVGYGSIGSQLSVLCEGLGMKVIYHDVLTKLPLGNAVQMGSFDELLEKADVVTLHVPDLPSTRNMMTAREFGLMKNGSFFINAARGGCVNINDLAAALESGKLLGAAIDVFPKEPKSADEEFISPLRAFENVILTPHVGGSTQEAQANIGLEVADKFVRYSDMGDTTSSVNFPNVSIPFTDKSHRLLHIHQNVPGVLSQVNASFADAGINITAQSMMTRGDVGYLVMDVDDNDSAKALERLRSVPQTIKVRVLF